MTGSTQIGLLESTVEGLDCCHTALPPDEERIGDDDNPALTLLTPLTRTCSSAETMPRGRARFLAEDSGNDVVAAVEHEGPWPVLWARPDW